jgi:hypothetical protein
LGCKLGKLNERGLSFALRHRGGVRKPKTPVAAGISCCDVRGPTFALAAWTTAIVVVDLQGKIAP